MPDNIQQFPVDDNSRVVNFDVKMTVATPRNPLGWVAMHLFYLATKLGLTIEHEPRMVLNSRFGDLPHDIRDGLVADLLTNDGLTVIEPEDDHD